MGNLRKSEIVNTIQKGPIGSILSHVAQVYRCQWEEEGCRWPWS